MKGILCMKNRNKYLAVWAVICLLVVIIGIALPVTRNCSLGLEGANQANLRRATEELTEGTILEFTVNPPEPTANQIGFFFTVNKHEFEEGILRIAAFDGEELIGGQDFPLEDLDEDRFLFISLDHSPEELTVRMTCDARRKGPSVWLNETTITPGHASVNGVPG